MEQRLARKLGKWTITGKFDFIGEGRVQDFKSTVVWTYLNQVNNNKYALQGSIYRWLDPKKITQDEMDIHFIFTDHQASKVKMDPSYPAYPFKRQVFPLLPLAETTKFILDKTTGLERYWSADEEDIPPCNDEDLWRSDPVFKYYKNPDKANQPGGRSTKNFTVDDFGSVVGARQAAHLRLSEEKGVGIIVEKPGEVMACKYCPAFPVCSQKDKLIAAGELNMG